MPRLIPPSPVPLVYALCHPPRHASFSSPVAARADFVWGGRIVPLTGETNGYPTLAEAKAADAFHPNCTHRLEVVT